MSSDESSAFFDLVLKETGIDRVELPIDVDRVEQLLDEHYGLRGRLERIATEKDDTFRLHAEDDADYLVKCSPSSEDPELVELQTATMVYLELHHPELPVQRVVQTQQGAREIAVPNDGAHFRILRVLTFIPGSLLKEGARTPKDWSLAGAMLGRVTHALETFSHPRDGRRLLWDMANFHRLTKLLTFVDDDDHSILAHRVFDDYCAVVVPRLPALATQVIHGDFSPFNAVVDPNDRDFVTGIIDFGDVVRTAVVFDVAVGMANVIGTDPDDPWGTAAAFLEGYQHTRPLAADELAVLREVVLGRLLLRGLVVYWRAKVDPVRHKYLLSHAARDWICLQHAYATDAATVRTLLRSTTTDLDSLSVGATPSTDRQENLP